jgi:hypothetical protein
MVFVNSEFRAEMVQTIGTFILNNLIFLSQKIAHEIEEVFPILNKRQRVTLVSFFV